MPSDGWRESTGISEDTSRVTIYCDTSDKKAWSEETQQQDYPSRSVYLYELIEDARAHRQEGFLSWQRTQERIEALEEQVDTLQSELEQEKRGNHPPSRFASATFVTPHLSYRYQSLEDIVNTVVSEESTEDLVQKPVEDTLYSLAENGTVEYRRGHGWRLSEGGDE
ncbi:hypothetical protein ACFQGT_02665 [Natrialbaceae archaeon GCM10025810]|uniref:hypothetical protein n=1 Tax=Halovalidus salilacus TaxID=3075124 RepID=UPI00362455B5